MPAGGSEKLLILKAERWSPDTLAEVGNGKLYLLQGGSYSEGGGEKECIGVHLRTLAGDKEKRERGGEKDSTIYFHKNLAMPGQNEREKLKDDSSSSPGL